MYFFIDFNQQVKCYVKKLNSCENSISSLNSSACSSGGGGRMEKEAKKLTKRKNTERNVSFSC